MNVLEEDPETQSIMDNFNHVGKRADKIRASYDVEAGRIVVENYTMTCPDCEGDGYYDERGDVICEDCGVVIVGSERSLAYSTGTTGQGFTTDTHFERKGVSNPHPPGWEEPIA